MLDQESSKPGTTWAHRQKPYQVNYVQHNTEELSVEKREVVVTSNMR